MGYNRTERREVVGGEEQQVHCEQRRVEADMPPQFRSGRRAGGLDRWPRGWAKEEEKHKVQSLIR